ncbi:MAG: HEAT repeat domain-containing protein [Candidatus Binatia bacterium]
MDKTLQSLLHLASEGSTEHRSGALLVLGALKLQDNRVVQTAGKALDHTNMVLRDYALRYFEQAKPKAGIPRLLPLLGDEDKDVRERAVRLLSGFGQAGVRPLLKTVRAASSVWMVNAARVLSAIRGKAAWKGLLNLLTQGDVEVNKAACDYVTIALRDMNEKEQEDLYTEVQSFAGNLDEQAQRTALISAIRLLGQLGRPQARRWLMGFASAGHHHSVRFHALVALLHCLREKDLHHDEVARLLPLLEEPEFSDLMRLTLELLESRPLPEKYRTVLSRLLESPHVAVQKFALSKMGEFDSPDVVRTLVRQLGDPDNSRREAAARSLRRIPAARTPLTKEFLSCDDASKAWAIAEILVTVEGKWRRVTLGEIWQRFQGAVDAADRIQGAYLHVLKSVDEKYAYTQLANCGTQLKRRKKYKEAKRFLSLLKGFSTFNVEEKFSLAVAHVKDHPHRIVPTARREDPAVELFGELYCSSAFPLLEALKKERALDPEDLFYLGFSFAERSAKERVLGKGLLEFLARRYPRTKVGRGAKNKLKILVT